MGTARLPAPHKTAFAQPFLSLDGPDGAGKSTQCRLLAGWCRDHGYPATECADPGGTDGGNVIRDAPLDRLESRDLAFHEKVRQGFLSEARRNPGRIRVVDARQSIEAVHGQIIEEVSHFLEAGPRP